MLVFEEIYLENTEMKNKIVDFLNNFHLGFDNDIDYSLAGCDEQRSFGGRGALV